MITIRLSNIENSLIGPNVFLLNLQITLQLELAYLNQQRLHPAQQYTENITDRKFIFIIKLPNQDHNTKLIR